MILPDNDVTVVLTATVDTKTVFGTARRDQTIRMNDYMTSLRSWLANDKITKLVICDNSGVDLSPIRKVCLECARPSQRVEILSFEGQDFDPAFGKGYGEMGILAHVAKNSELLRSSRYMLKCTGRLHVGNADEIMRRICMQDTVDVFCNLSLGLRSTDCRVFACTGPFLENYLLPLQDFVNDSLGKYFEEALARAVHQAMGVGMQWSLMPITPRIYGINATYDRKYSTSYPYWLSREGFRLLKKLVMSR